ncbi:MAG: hypothetical protein JW709_00845, partial [Sedimentisphaerales bacterium]|nr:hypothetical protein [Sedimentisphaerales bacterium]
MIKASILCSFFVVMINMLSGGGSVFGDVKAVETLSPRLHFNMDDSWKFYKGDASEAMNPDFDDVAWDDVNLPHDWSIEGPFDKDLEHRGGYLPSGIGWYRKTITLSPDWRGRRIFIEFEGVFRNSVVFVNGKEVGKNIFGYTGANYDITDFVRFEEKNNIIAVKIDNPDTGDYRANSEGWWYEGCGIYRHVWLTATNPLHVDHNGMFITTPQVSKAQASVRLSSTIRNDTKEKCLCTVKHSLYKADGSFIGSETVENVAVPPQFTKDIASLFVIDSPKLWSPDAPYLYTAATQVISQEKVLDAHQTTFGVRWFEFTPDKGFFLNGKHLQLRGMCVHHDFGGLGVALPDRANYKTVEEAKKMGCNLIRSAHNDAAPALMEACDRLGMLVWAETRYMDNAWNWVTDAVLLEQCPEALRYLIRRDRNHPAIICWGLANTAGSADGVRTKHLQVFNDIARAEDPTRPTAVALERNTNANANGFAMVTDIVGYNGGGMGIDDADHRNYPDRKMLISEFSSGRCARGIYERVKLSEGVEETLGDGRVIRLDGKYLSNYDGCIRHEKEWRHVAQRPWLAGGIIWSGIE